VSSDTPIGNALYTLALTLVENPAPSAVYGRLSTVLCLWPSIAGFSNGDTEVF